MANIPTANNNPGDLRDPSTGSFRKFATPQEGYAALLNDLQTKINGKSTTGLNGESTLADFANKYAPKGDGANNPAHYTANLANSLKVRPDTKLKDLQPRIGEFAEAVAKNEGWNGTYSASNPQSTKNNPPSSGLSNFNSSNTQKNYPGSGLDTFVNNTSSSTDTPSSSYTPPAPGGFGQQAGKLAGLVGQGLIAPGKGVAESLTAGLIPHLQDFKNAQEGAQKSSDMATKTLQAIRKAKAAGKDTTGLQNAYNMLTGTTDTAQQYKDLNPAASKSNAQALAEVGALGGELLGAGTYGTAAEGMTTGSLAPVFAKATLPSLATAGASTIAKKASQLTAGKVARGLLYYLAANKLSGNKGPIGIAHALMNFVE